MKGWSVGLALLLATPAALSGQLAPTGWNGAAAADLSGFDQGSGTRGRVDLSWSRALATGLRVQVEGSGGWTRTSWGRSAGGYLGSGRLMAGSERLGLTIGAGLGQAFPVGPAQKIARIEALGHSRVAGLDLELSLRRIGLSGRGTDSGTDPRSGATGDTLGVAPQRVLKDHYTDLDLLLGWSRNRLELEGGVGRRIGSTAFQATTWRARLLYWFSGHLGISAGAGYYPSDVVSGLPRGRYAAVGLRVSLRDRTAGTPASRLARHSDRHAGFRTPSRDGRYDVEVYAPAARSVEIAGNFNDWTPMPLVPGHGGWWRAPLALSPGVYRLNVRIDGGSWAVPAGMAVQADDFGGTAGILALPGAD